MGLLIKALIGALMVIVIAMLAKTKNYYLAGLIPLFPTFALIAHFIVGTEKSVGELKSALVFGMFSLIPYFIYLLSLYILLDRFKLVISLISAAAVWAVAASLLVLIWSRIMS